MTANSKRKFWIIWLSLAILAVVSLIIALLVWIFSISGAANDTFKREAAQQPWKLSEVVNGEALPAEYKDAKTLYLFSTNDAIRKGYKFQQCNLGEVSLSAMDTTFNLPSNGSNLFLVGKFDGAGAKRDAAKLNCPGLPAGNNLGIGYMENQR